MSRILYKYIIHEIWPTFLTSLLVFIFIVLAARVMSILDWMINHGVQPLQVIRMILYLLPSIILFALPAAALMAVLIAFIRLSGDNEILAMKSSGISLYQLLNPVLVFSLICGFLAMMIAVFGAPWGNHSFKEVAFQVVRSNIDLNVKERIFFEPFQNVTFFINNFSSREKTMQDVFVVDRREPSMTNTIIARKGRILVYPGNRMITIQFLDGTIYTMANDFGSARNVKFDTYDLNIGLDDMIPSQTSRKKSPQEMSIRQLYREIHSGARRAVERNEMIVELVEKFSIPFAVFFMGIIGVPLGAHIKSSGRFPGIIISLAIFLTYYICLAGVRSICETGVLSPTLGPWIPVALLGLFSLYLLPAAANENPFHPFEKVRNQWRRFFRNPAFPD